MAVGLGFQRSLFVRSKAVPSYLKAFSFHVLKDQLSTFLLVPLPENLLENLLDLQGTQSRVYLEIYYIVGGLALRRTLRMCGLSRWWS